MCGILGVKNLSPLKRSDVISRMLEKIRHRGPDANGFFSHENIYFGHTRLAIHDLTQTGSQPMTSYDGEWVIVFNGEIYNHQEIKNVLLKENPISFKGNSDTEILINAIATFGIKKTLELSVGMFAFAAYKVSERKLYLVRDRFGEKPLYYGQQNGIFAFSSELKALKPLVENGWKFDINRDVLATYMRLGYVPTPYSIYANIKKLEAASYLEIDDAGSQSLYRYWNDEPKLFSGKFSGEYESATSVLEHKLQESVRLQMHADVPVGAFLSGGIDSSIIVSLMQTQSSKKINTFSIGFHEKELNEAIYAKKVASHLGTNHTELYATEKDALSLIPDLSEIYDEPFSDSSQIPTCLVSKLTRSSVKVALSGDGGDELFGGYNRYIFAEKVKKNILDRKFRKFFISHLPGVILTQNYSVSKRVTTISEKLMKLKNIVSNAENSYFGLYSALVSQIHQSGIVLGGAEIPATFSFPEHDLKFYSYQEWMMYTDSKTYMMDDILTKVDRAAMSVSLETRVPFLDHRIYEFAWSLPIDYKINNNVGKRILKDILYRYIPKDIVDRPKMGFAIPLARWLRNELKPWAEELLNPKKIKEQGYLDANLVKKYWEEHLKGKHNWQSALWTILMFQMWLENENKTYP